MTCHTYIDDNKQKNGPSFSMYGFQAYTRNQILKWLGSTFVDGLRRILNHQPMEGLLQNIYIPVLF